MEGHDDGTVTFTVPDDVPGRWTTAQLPEGDRALGVVKITLTAPDGTVHVHERIDVDHEGVLRIPMPDDPQAGAWKMERGHLLRSMMLLPLGR